MKISGYMIGLCLLLVGADSAHAQIDWNALKNPVLAYPATSIQDFSCVYQNSTFHLFFTRYTIVNDKEEVRLCAITTPDFKRFSKPTLHENYEDEHWAGAAAPQVSQNGDTFYCVFQRIPKGQDQLPQLFLCTSTDLTHWSQPKPLAVPLTQGKYCGEPALAWHKNKGYLFWKEGAVRKRNDLRCAVTEDGATSFKYIGFPSFRLKNGIPRQVGSLRPVRLGKTWTMAATLYASGCKTALFTMTGSGDEDQDWTLWREGYILDTPAESFNTIHTAKTACLLDHRDVDGYAYLLYAGNADLHRFSSRGWSQMGMARAADLRQWETPAPK